MPIYKLKLLARHEVAQGTSVFTFEKPDGFTFKPGQYGGFTLINPTENDTRGHTRRFSLLSIPEDNHLSIAIRLQNIVNHSAFKRILNQLPIGGEIKFAGPMGNFILHEDLATPAVLIAGGIGITPFYSMILQAALHQPNRHIHLFYGNQSPPDTAFLAELMQLETRYPNFKLIVTMANPGSTWHGETGFITEKMIRKYVPELAKPIYYICGPQVMVTTLQEMLAEMGIDEDRIKVEDFPGY